MAVNTDPVAVVLVTSGTRGDRLLFRFPNLDPESNREVTSLAKGKNPYRVKIAEDLDSLKGPVFSSIKNNILVGFSGGILSNLLAVKPDLCGKPFDVKVDDVRFVGYPMLLDPSKTKVSSSGKSSHQIISFNVVFVLRASVSSSVITSYNDLVKQLTVAIHHEENRCQYLSTQAKIMISVHDEVAALPEDSVERESPFDLILQKSSLARDLKSITENLCDSGVVHMFLNRWIEISYCMPHKIHVLPGPVRPIRIEPEVIQRCLQSLRPYHGILLLEDKQFLQESLPSDSSPAISRLISATTPMQSLQDLSLESDLTLSQIFQIVSHLVYWAKALIIYPLCETNCYVLSPSANLYSDSLVRECAQQFDKSLPEVMAEFSYPTTLSESKDILNPPKQQEQKVKMVVWMLQKHLLIKLHTYIIFAPPLPRHHKKFSDESLVRSGGMPIVPEEESLAYCSDIASVNSDESYSAGVSSTYNSQFSKSPSSDSSVLMDDKSYWPLQDGLGHLTKEEREAVYNVPAAKNAEDVKLFTRLCPYFNGKHHIEEIMYYEDLHRSQLLTILDKFRQILITCQYQDPATSFTDIT